MDSPASGNGLPVSRSEAERGGGSRPVPFLFSIDTEEDNWVPARRGATVANIRELPGFHELLTGLGVHPTYFTAWTVARDPSSAAVMRDIAGDAAAEVAAHLHPWNTPPLTEAPLARHTMLCNLPAALQRQKLEVLTHSLADLLGRTPTSFRAGRFGMSAALVRPLLELGYRADSSVTPYWSWASYDDGPDHRGAPVTPYRLSGEATDVRVPEPGGELCEIPPSLGYTRRPFAAWSRLHDRITAPGLSALRLSGVASRLGIVRKVILTPEGERLADLVAAARQMLRESGYLHMFMHSSSLVPGLSPFAATPEAVAALRARVADFVRALQDLAPLEFMTVTAFADRLLERDAGPGGLAVAARAGGA